MKTKILVLAALMGAAAMSANAGVHLSIGLPLPVIVSHRVVVATPCLPAPPVVLRTVPPCPGVNFVLVNGCWSPRPMAYAYRHGGWDKHQAHYAGHRQFYGEHRR